MLGFVCKLYSCHSESFDTASTLKINSAKSLFLYLLRPAATIFTTSLRLHDGKIKERNFKFTGNQNYRSAFQGQVDFLVEHFLAQKGEPPENILSSTINLNVLLAIQYIASRIHDVSSTNRKTEYIFRTVTESRRLLAVNSLCSGV